ncbi:hypothetical protein BIW11_14055 [Tropilaelaps mercedesae]|uniref:Uncharacterized protein n=1 Tax=Tropilaelaps mercedesae TaxID=418985 RepID=A0A1V9WZE8_9ACAR|nr:hypothetical protein BIW11_14055 [Tropilaelaps mercedesae]
MRRTRGRLPLRGVHLRGLQGKSPEGNRFFLQGEQSIRERIVHS